MPSSTSGSPIRARRNLSLATQLRACEEYCERQGFVMLERFKEQGASAKTADRTELQSLLQYCRTNKGKVHFVVVFNLTRERRTTTLRCVPT